MQIRTIQLIMLMLWWPQVVNILLNIKMRCAKKSDNSFSKLPGNLLTDWSFQRQQMENIAMSSKALWYSNSSVSSLPDGSPLKFKARYCVHAGDLQTEGVNYFEMYLPVVQWWSKFWNWFRVKRALNTSSSHKPSKDTTFLTHLLQHIKKQSLSVFWKICSTQPHPPRHLSSNIMPSVKPVMEHSSMVCAAANTPKHVQ